jgi:hypothetical protein
VQQTVTNNADGSTTVANAAYNPGGTLAETIATTTSANGLDKTTVTSNGSGIVLDTQTDDTVVNDDGSTAETLSDYNGLSGDVIPMLRVYGKGEDPRSSSHTYLKLAA